MFVKIIYANISSQYEMFRILFSGLAVRQDGKETKR